MRRVTAEPLLIGLLFVAFVLVATAAFLLGWLP